MQKPAEIGRIKHAMHAMRRLIPLLMTGWCFVPRGSLVARRADSEAIRETTEAIGRLLGRLEDRASTRALACFGDRLRVVSALETGET